MLVGQMVDHFCSQGNFNPFNHVKKQYPKLSVKIIQRNYVVKSAIWLKNMIYLIGLHRPPIACQTVVANI